MDQEFLYIGTKIIKAVKMTECSFIESQGKERPDQDDRHGYKVTYEDGYVSWSPKATFEAAYRLISPKEMELMK